MDEVARDYDVVVVGGGPGGSSTATTLARLGKRTLLLERDLFPRFHIGESQLPGINGILKTLGATECVEVERFVEKWGANFTNSDGRFSQYADFALAAETPIPLTYQVPRDRFDRVLLEHAGRSGAVVIQGARVEEAAFDAEGVLVRYTEPGGESRTVRAAAIADASGRSGFLAKRFGKRLVDPVLRNIAVHAQFEGVPRQEGRRSGDIQMVTRPDLGWFWLIPISETVMSVGAVIPKAVHDSRPRTSPEESLTAYVEETPAAAELMKHARRVSPGRIDADYSYLATQHAGDRWVLVGDAGAFLDPIFSTGVLMAMQSGIEAGQTLADGVDRGDLSRRAFTRFERTVRRRYRYFRRFACGFYDPAFRDLFFVRSKYFGIYEAVLSVIAGNWEPSLLTRLRIACFFGLVALQKRLTLAPRVHSEAWAGR